MPLHVFNISSIPWLDFTAFNLNVSSSENYLLQLKSLLLDKSKVIAYLENDIAALKSKNPDDLKKIIQTYIEKVVIYEEHVEVHLFFLYICLVRR
ncbi:CatA-like O-acetyltransferase [Anaerosinus gibii]|uniref:CatA-like O-acetyltransferase n=1 Tax=Selenobaculum gibii TaxID=3054208 RepID=UPI0011CB73B4